MAKHFFSKDSFWNQPIGPDPQIDPRSDHFIHILRKEPSGNFGINTRRWTIPVYEVDDHTPRRTVRLRVYTDDQLRKAGHGWVIGRTDRFGHGPGFGQNVPIPAHATPDPEGDEHMAMVNWKTMEAWDMWGLRKAEDGEWESNTGMKYRLDGNGIFKMEDFSVKDDDSIHFHGPSRAAGVPAIAGLIMHDEVLEGEIHHKLAFATRFNALKQFVFPACWTDGFRDDGLPEGATIQLDPSLNLDKFNLLPGERAVARAMQVYGMVDVDNAGGNSLYAEGLWGHEGKDWQGILRPVGGISQIPLDHYRVLKLGKITHMGDPRWKGGGQR